MHDAFVVQKIWGARGNPCSRNGAAHPWEILKKGYQSDMAEAIILGANAATVIQVQKYAGGWGEAISKRFARRLIGQAAR